MDGDDEQEGDPLGNGWVDPDDRLWRHPSEVSPGAWPQATIENPFAAPRIGAEPKLWAVAMLAGLIGAMLAGGVITLTGGFRHQSTTIVQPIETLVSTPITSVSTAAATSGNATSSGNPTSTPDIVGIAQRLSPSIVQLLVTTGAGSVSGSGVLFRSDGNILTDSRVVQGSTGITVTLANGRQYKARLVGADALTDIAVVHVDADTPMIVAPLGTAKGLKVGQQAMAMGSPLGGASVTAGVVSAVGRDVTTDAGSMLVDMIQTDAHIDPNSSGGALVDTTGAVIGITTVLSVSDTKANALGFAVPIDVARDTANQLIDTGKVVHGWIGIDGEDVDSATAGLLAIPGGALLKQVTSHSPASAAGLAAGDIVVAVGDQTVDSLGGLVVLLRSHRPGDKINIGYLRDGRIHRSVVTIAVHPTP